MHRRDGVARGYWRRAPLRIAAALALLLAAAAPARADTVDTILDYLAKAGVIDPAIKDAKPLIDCLVKHNGNANACVNVKSLAEQQGKAAAQQFVPDDPKIQGAFQVVSAVHKGDWVRVVEVAGVKVLLPLACDLGLATTGPLKGFVCKDAMKQIVARVAEPAVRELLGVLASGDPAKIVWKAITLAGSVDLACALLPAFPGKDVPCSVFGKALAEIGGAFADAAKYGAKIVVSAADGAENLIFGDDSHMPYDKYYALYWLPWLHYGTKECMTDPKNCGGLAAQNQVTRERCVDYFDSHNQYRSTAKKTCDNMRYNRLTPAARAMAQAMEGAAEAQALQMRPFARMWVVEAAPEAFTPARRQTFDSGCQIALRKEFPLPEADPARCEMIKKSPMYKTFKPGFDKAYANCISDVKKQTPSPSAHVHACTQARHTLEKVVQEENAALLAAMQRLVSLGCKTPAGWTAAKGPQFECKGRIAFENCRVALKAGNEAKRCTYIPSPADAQPLSASTAVKAAPTAAAGTPAVAPAKPAPPAAAGPDTVPAARHATRTPSAASAPVASAASKPDLVASPQVQLLRRGGSEKGQWGGSITVEDAAAPSAQNGKCYFGLHFEVRNAGGAPAPVFQVALSAEGEPPGVRQAGPLAPGASSSHEIYVNLRPGANVLRLRVDSQQQVAEADEGNNAPTLAVNVKGSCGGTASGGRLRQSAAPAR
jgi:hypothetical protein